MADQEYEEEEELDLDSIEDEQTLIELLDEAEDFDERKRIRARLMKVQHEIRAQREKDRKRREEEREQALRNKVKDADMKKKKTLEMYSEMAKGGTPAGRKGSLSGAQNSTEKPKDLVEEAIKDRLQAADNRKKRILAAYDHAAKSQPAGGYRVVDFDAFSSADVSKLEKPKPVKGSCCFSMSGGVPKVDKVVPASVPKPRTPVDESELDPMERAIRARVKEAEERKRRTLAAYDMAARTGGAGPKVVILEEFKDLQLDHQPKKQPKYDPCFRGGLKT